MCDFCNQRLDQIDQIHVLLEQSSAVLEILELAVTTSTVSNSAIVSALAVTKGKIKKTQEITKGQDKVNNLIAI